MNMKWLMKLKNKKIILLIFGVVFFVLIIFALLPAGFKKDLSSNFNKLIGNKENSAGSSQGETSQGSNQKNNGNNGKGGKDQTTAAETLADQKIETLEKLPYGSLATKKGSIYPQGSITDSETVKSGGYTFNVHTSITYGDNEDSKIINVEVKDSSDNETLADSSKEVPASGGGATSGNQDDNSEPRIIP